MAGFDLAEGIRKAFYAGVGAVATGAEKSAALVDELVKKGELTVDQGRELNAELTRKAKEAVSDAGDAALKARLRAMTSEERAAWVAKASKLASELDDETIEVEAEVADDEAQSADDEAQE